VSETTPDIVIVGSHAPGLRLDVDALPQPGETILGRSMSWPLDGGKGSNQALAAAKLGARVAFVGCVGTDTLGESAAQLMAAAGIDVRHLVRSSETSTGCGVNIVDGRGVPEMITVPGANAELTVDHVSAAFDTYRHPKIVLTQLEIPPAVAMHAADLAKRHGAIAIVNAAPAVSSLVGENRRPANIDVLVVNEVEAAMLDSATAAVSEPVNGGGEVALLSRLRLATGARTVIITLGARGLVAEHDGRQWRLPAVEVTPTDTSGAGDVFCAALATVIAEGGAMREACAWANVAAAVSVTRPGTIPAFPTRGEVETTLAQHAQIRAALT
jgi:ribokinase